MHSLAHFSELKRYSPRSAPIQPPQFIHLWHTKLMGIRLTSAAIQEWLLVLTFLASLLGMNWRFSLGRMTNLTCSENASEPSTSRLQLCTWRLYWGDSTVSVWMLLATSGSPREKITIRYGLCSPSKSRSNHCHSPRELLKMRKQLLKTFSRKLLWVNFQVC